MKPKANRQTYESYDLLFRNVVEIALSKKDYMEIISLAYLANLLLKTYEPQGICFFIGAQIYAERKGWA